MKTVIIEDELLAAEDLAETLRKLPGNIQVKKILGSVGEAVQYFKHNEQPDLIFCDIHLGDGHSFEIFKKVKVEAPVIFCTAFDEFALEAYNNNGIGYVMKPFSGAAIRKAIEKYETLRNKLSSETLAPPAPANQQVSSSLLVNCKDRIIPVKISDIAFFAIEYKTTRLITFSGEKYFLSQALDELELQCGAVFFRANRQYLVNKNAIQEALQYYSRKLVLVLNFKTDYRHEIIISKNKVPEFLHWLQEG